MAPFVSTLRSTTEQMQVCDILSLLFLLIERSVSGQSMLVIIQTSQGDLKGEFCGCLGLVNACNILQEIADKYEGVSYADLFQMASAMAVKVQLCYLLCTLPQNMRFHQCIKTSCHQKFMPVH